MKKLITIPVTPRQIEATGYLLRIATEQLERSPATRKQIDLSLTDIAEIRRLNKKLVRAFLKSAKTQ